MAVKANEFRIGQRVRYMPLHVMGNINHPDVEIGVVSEIRNDWVMVKYGTNDPKDENVTAKATAPWHLR